MNKNHRAAMTIVAFALAGLLTGCGASSSETAPGVSATPPSDAADSPTTTGGEQWNPPAPVSPGASTGPAMTAADGKAACGWLSTLLGDVYPPQGGLQGMSAGENAGRVFLSCTAGVMTSKNGVAEVNVSLFPNGVTHTLRDVQYCADGTLHMNPLLGKTPDAEGGFMEGTSYTYCVNNTEIRVGPYGNVPSDFAAHLTEALQKFRGEGAVSLAGWVAMLEATT